MKLDEARNFLKANHRAVLITNRRAGGLQTSPVVVGIDDDWRAVISSRETAYKTKNLRRDPRATLCVINDGFFGDWIRIDGRAEIVSLPEAMDGLIAYYRGISGEHPDWDDYRGAMEREQRCLVRIDIQDAGPERSG